MTLFLPVYLLVWFVIDLLIQRYFDVFLFYFYFWLFLFAGLKDHNLVVTSENAYEQMSSTVKRLFENFRDTGSVGDAKHTGRSKTNRSNYNTEQCVRVSVTIQKPLIGVVNKHCEFQ